MITRLSKPVYFLLVDDLEENLLSLDALLRRDGLVLLKARSGKEALELLLEHNVALALLDVQMPDMDGFELAELMRGTERTRRIPIIFLTAGTADLQRRFRGYEAGAVDFLNKPIEPDILRSKAQVFFELFRQQQILAFQRDELQANAEALKESDRRKDEFLATLAHELRNPLAPLRNGLEVLKLSPDQAVSENVREMMGRQLSHLVRLIDDLLDVSRVSQGKIDLRKEPVMLQAALQSAIDVSNPHIKGFRHTLITDIPEEPLWLHADLTRLAQIISNLLNNAAKYTPEEGVIKILAKQEEKYAVVTISDNGIGIPPDMLQKIFDLFIQVQSDNIEKPQSGLGIGLALVKKLVALHGGTISARSDGLGKGSTFTLRIPLANEKSDQNFSDKNTSATHHFSKPLKILMIDDNIDAAQTTAWMLELLGHEVVIGHDGFQALEKAKEYLPDTILLDIGLPGMSGYDVCRALRKDPQFKDTTIIAQTGWGQERDRQKAQEAGFNHHLLKPINIDELSKILKGIQASQT